MVRPGFDHVSAAPVEAPPLPPSAFLYEDSPHLPSPKKKQMAPSLNRKTLRQHTVGLPQIIAACLIKQLY